MIGFLRFLGVTNAAIWLGTAVLYPFVLRPAFKSREMVELLPFMYGGAVDLILLQRFYAMLEWCGAVALIHLLVEWLYTNKPIRKSVLYLVVGLFAFSLLGGHVMTPNLRELHIIRFGVQSSEEQKEQATNGYRILERLIKATQWVTAAGTLVFVWRLTHSFEGPRFYSRTQYRS